MLENFFIPQSVSHSLTKATFCLKTSPYLKQQLLCWKVDTFGSILHPTQARFLFLIPGKTFWVQFPTPRARTTVKCLWIATGDVEASN